jgi:hypothetical protein
MKRRFAAFILVAGIITQLSNTALAGQQSGGSGSYPPAPTSGGMPNDQNNQNKTGQEGDNTSKIYGDNNKVEQNNTLVNQTNQYNRNDSFSPKSSSNSSATSGSSSGSSATGGQSSSGSNIKFGDSQTTSHYDGRQDGGAHAAPLSSVYNNTNTYVKLNNVCGVTMAEAGTTPLTNQSSFGAYAFGFGGASFANSKQKFSKEQTAINILIASNLSRLASEQALYMSHPVLARHYLEMGLEADFGKTMKPSDAHDMAMKIALEVTSVTPDVWQGMVSQSIRNAAQLCSIYSQPRSEAPPTIYTPPTQPIPVINVPNEIPAKN